MAIINFKYKKLEANLEDKKTSTKGAINLTYGLKFLNCEEFKPTSQSQIEGFLKVQIELKIIYKDLANMTIVSEMLMAQPKAIVEECLKSWKDSKIFPQTIAEGLNTFAFRKMMAKAFSLADDLDLPNPYPIPKLTITKKEDSKNK